MVTKAKAVRRPKKLVVDEKSSKSLRTITNYLSATAVSYGIGVLFNIWYFFSGDERFLSSGPLNITGFLGLGVILIWCIRLLKQMNALSLWVFLAFGLGTYVWLIVSRLILGTPVFSSIDIVLGIFVVGFSNELYKLKKSGTLH